MPQQMIIDHLAFEGFVDFSIFNLTLVIFRRLENEC